jgi:hypothetical protein
LALPQPHTNAVAISRRDKFAASRAAASPNVTNQVKLPAGISPAGIFMENKNEAAYCRRQR